MGADGRRRLPIGSGHWSCFWRKPHAKQQFLGMNTHPQGAEGRPTLAQFSLKNHWTSMNINQKSMKIHENPWKSLKIHWKSMKINENPWKFNENQWKSMKINENQWKPSNINGNHWTPVVGVGGMGGALKFDCYLQHLQLLATNANMKYEMCSCWVQLWGAVRGTG